MRRYKNGPLPEKFEKSAVITVVGEFAFKADRAEEYLLWCIENDIAVTGFEVWLTSENVVAGGVIDGTASVLVPELSRVDNELGGKALFVIFSD